MKILVGQYNIGYRNVDLYVDPDSQGSGHFSLAPDKGVSEMVIGIKLNYWHEVFEILFHESMELALCDVGGRFKRNPTWVSGHDGYLFSFTHDNFSEAVVRASYFISKSQNAVAKLHRKYLAKAKRKKK